MNTNMINCAGFVSNSIVDGYGIRFVVFTQGCPHHCFGCHNPETHAFDIGKNYSVEELFAKIINTHLIKGVTFSGGEPLCQAKPLNLLADKILQQGLDLTIFTGFTMEQILSSEDNFVKELISKATLVVDGKFELQNKDLLLQFRGSKNQRLLSGIKSIEANAVVDYEKTLQETTYSF